METAAKAILGAFVVIPGLAALIAAAAIWRGYALSILWGWFIVPAFGAAHLSIPLAIGVSLIATALTNHRTYKEVEDNSKKWTPLVILLVQPAFLLLFGWVAKQYL